MATFNKRGPNQWQVKIRKKGYPATSNTFSTKAEAQKWARHVESEMDRGIFLSTSEAENTTLQEILERYNREVVPTKKSSDDMRSRLNLINSAMGHLSLAAITPAIVKEYRDYRLETVGEDTVRKDMSILSRVLKVAQSEWDINLPRGNPCTDIQRPSKGKSRERRLSPEEESVLLETAKDYSPDIADIIGIAIETGMRRGEIVKMNWDNTDLTARTALILDTKNGTDRNIPLSSKAVEILRQRPQDSAQIFQIRADSITKAFTRICQKAELEDLRFHDLRHEATSRFFELGLGIMEVSAITGHKDLSMLKRYTHLKAEDLAMKLN